MDDPQSNLSMLEYFRGHSRSLKSHFEVTSGFIKDAPMEMKFDMNDPQDNLTIYNGSTKVIKGSLLGIKSQNRSNFKQLTQTSG